MGPLSGIKVLDLSRVLAGPWAGQLFSDLGAEVIKVEKPGEGDDTRHWGPPFISDEAGDKEGDAAYFLAANRGKRSIELDISKPESLDVIHRLVKQSDIIIENFKVGGLAKYGLDYASLAQIKPDVIYCSITGFGQTGPYAPRAGYDFMVQAMGGLMSLTGERDGLAGGGPQKVGIAISDLTTGLYATIGILAALRHRDQSGEGQHIDMALLDVTVGMLANQNMNYLVSGVPPKRHGNAHLNIVPYQSFKTADSHIILAVGNDRQFASFCQLVSRNDLAEDTRFAANPNRVINRDILVPILAEILEQHPTSYWLETLEQVAVPCGPVQTLDEVFADPQVKARGLKMDLPHASAGSVPQVATPIKFSKTNIIYGNGPPTLGEHSAEILTELGYGAEEISNILKANE